ncbi:MAG: amidophosphoribosyltransferase [Parcubacteria group bacterium Gr01-1014_70]|nr:MAG: amidophosphoribosyltransferase [Parcubacteria group bacterium Gr01-1014_70]
MCGIVGGFNLFDVINCSRALQHRGQQGFGIGFFGNDNDIHVLRREGEVPQALWSIDLSDLQGSSFVTHTRYSTTGAGTLENVQPVYRKNNFEFALVHNGNIVNMHEIERITNRSYANLSDTHAIADLIAQSPRSTIEEAIQEACMQLRGSYNLLVLHNGNIHVIRDPHGFHPLQLGLSAKGEYLVASESYAFDFVGGKLLRDIHPGEYIVISKDTCTPITRFPRIRHPHIQLDIFELQYYASPFSIIHGVHVGTARQLFGMYLVQETKAMHNLPPGTVVAPVPDSGNQVALGMYKELLHSGFDVDYNPYLISRSHTTYVHRAYIEPTVEQRLQRIQEKYTVSEMHARGRNVLLGDDTIVGGLTSRFIANKAQAAGARSVSYGISAPPNVYPDVYGNDQYARYTRKELIAHKHKGNEVAIAKEIGANNVWYLSLKASIRAILDARALTRSMCTNLPPLDTQDELNEHSFHTAPYSGFYAEGTGDYPVKSLDLLPILQSM